MPLELGMAMARRYMGTADDHQWLILAPKGHAYLRFVSDLAAFDPATCFPALSRREKKNIHRVGRVSALARDCFGRNPRRKKALRSLTCTNSCNGTQKPIEGRIEQVRNAGSPGPPPVLF